MNDSKYKQKESFPLHITWFVENLHCSLKWLKYRSNVKVITHLDSFANQESLSTMLVL